MLKKDATALDRFQDTGVSVHSPDEDDEWLNSLVIAAGDDFSRCCLIPKIMYAVVIAGRASTSGYPVIWVVSAALIASSWS
ncbi:MAG: hypothetical protein ACRDTH_29165 [Pseudonocardiaceae bacterium]